MQERDELKMLEYFAKMVQLLDNIDTNTINVVNNLNVINENFRIINENTRVNLLAASTSKK